MGKLPIKITPDCILQAIIEIRFEPKVQEDAVFHFINESNVVKESFKFLSNTPIYELPPQIRNNELGFRFSPYFSLEGKGNFSGYNLQVGPRVLSLVTDGEYQGSELFLERANELLVSVGKQNVIRHVERLGIRYIDLFESNIFGSVKLQITLPGKDIDHSNSSLRLQFPEQNGFTTVLVLGSKARVESVKDKSEKNGSLLDIDCFSESIPSDFLSNPKSLLKTGHIEQKSLFFSLLKEDFLQSLNPQYGD